MRVRLFDVMLSSYKVVSEVCVLYSQYKLCMLTSKNLRETGVHTLMTGKHYDIYCEISSMPTQYLADILAFSGSYAWQ